MAPTYSPTIGTYRATIDSLREAVARDFPEYARDIYVVDQSQDATEEIARAAKAFERTRPRRTAACGV